MTPVLYLLRSPSHISPALSKNPEKALVITVDDMALLPKPAKIVTAPIECEVKAGELLSYRELIDLLVKVEKVVTL